MASSGTVHEGGGGRYTLFAEILTGPMASVHVGRLVSSTGATRAVTLKKVYPEFAKDTDFVATLLDEARLASRVKHPNVVLTVDIVRDHEQLLLVTDYVEGESLAHLARAVSARRERFDVRVACAVIAGALHGLHAAHEAKNEFGEPLGIVHGDVSMESVLVGVDGVARMEGFGVARAMGKSQKTRAESDKDRLAYQSPEQIRGGTITRLSDIWTVGVVLWETLTGRPLFAGATPAVVLKNVVSAEVPGLSSAAPDAPHALDAIVKKALSRAPVERFPTARAMALAIEQAVPLALASEVSEYLERACSESLARKRELLREIEAATTKTTGAGIIPSSEFIADALWSNLPKGPPTAPAPALAVSPAFSPAPAFAPAHAPASALASAFASAPAFVPAASPSRPPEPRGHASWAVPLGGIVGLGVLVLLLGPLVVPAYAKQKAQEAAAARGISLTIEDASGGYTAVHFHRLGVSIPDVPGLHAEIADVDVDLASFRPVHAKLSRVEVTLDGAIPKTLANVTLWNRGHHGGKEASDTDGMRVEVPTAKVVWTHAFGENGRIDALDVSGELAPKASVRLGDELRFTTSKLSATTPADTLGPWRVDVEQDPNATTARVAFDPPVPDGPSAIVTYMTTGKALVDVNIPRSPLVRLGVSSSAVAYFKHVPSQAELKLHYVKTTDGRVDATLALALYGLHVPPMPGTPDVHVAGSVGGDGASPLDLVGGTISVGPVKATLAGPVVLRADGVSGNLAWKAAPIPCSQLLPKSDQAAGDLAAQLGALGAGTGDLTALGADVTALAQAAGVAKVSGNLAAYGTLVFDTSDVPGTVFTVAGKNSCGVGFFAPR